MENQEKTPSRKTLLIIAACVLFGLYCSEHLVGVYINTHVLGLADTGICKGNGLSCAAAAKTAFASFFGLFPTASLGLACYATLLLLSAVGIVWPGRTRRLGDTLFAIALLCFLYSCMLAVVSAFWVGTFCPYCTMLYGLNILLLVVATLGHPEGLKTALRRLFKVPAQSSAWLAFAVMFAASAAAYARYNSQNQEAVAQMAQKAALDAELAKTKGRPTPGDAVLRGFEKAPVEVILFSDFECPYCRKLAATFDEILEEEPGLVRMYFKHMPMSFHKNAEKAAVAAVCAGRQNQFWKMHDRLFASNNALEPEKLPAYAAEIGIDAEAFSLCLDDPTALDVVKKDADEAVKLGVEGTPTFYVNGRKVPGAMPKDRLMNLLREAEKEASAQP